MAENKDFDEIDEQVLLKEGELTKEEVEEKTAKEEAKKNQQIIDEKEKEKLQINFSLPDPKKVLNEKIENLKKKLEKHRDKIIVIGVSLISLFIVLIIILAFLNRDENVKKIDLNSELDVYSDLAFNKPEVTIENRVSQVEELVQKANILYQEGNKNEALKLYGRIATYNASLSYYNLGVARVKKGLHQEAVDAFDKAIQNREHITPSAINAAVCSLKLNKPDEMSAYLDLAYKHLPESLESPLYSYYYSLIAFYRGSYFETFSSLKHRTSEFFEDEKNMMESRVNLLFENYGGSAEALKKALSLKDVGNLGLIYANMGKLDLAKDNLEKAIENANRSGIEKEELMKIKYSHALVNLKLGNVKDSGLNIMALNDMYEKKLDNAYGLELSLKETLFDVQKAQTYFEKDKQFVKYTNYQVLFYFAPYKVFNAKKSINYIKKGSVNIAIGDSGVASNYLEKGAKSSDVNKDIILAVKEALSKRLRVANKILREIEKDNPKHAVLHYDLGLTYAQLGDMSSAHKHFKRSFHLNSRDYMSGIFAILSGDLLGVNLNKLEDVFRENLSFELENEEKELYQALLYLKADNFIAMQKWADNLKQNSKEDLFNLGLSYLITTLLDSKEKNRVENKKISKKILGKLPNDIFAHLLFMYSNFKDLDIKLFSKSVIRHFQTNPLPLYDFYYGARVTQEMFIKFHLLTGHLEELQTKLEHYYKVELKNPEGIIQSLALTKLYNKDYESSYRLYNKLIDDYNVKDSRTLFLAGVSALASKHYANAVALFELAKLKNKMNLETRYALGLLYLESKHFGAGGIQFKRFKENYFFSDFFDFNVKIPKSFEN